MQPSSSRAGMTTESSESCGRDGSLMMPEFPIHPDPPTRGDDDIHSFVGPAKVVTPRRFSIK
jgi:hypothetical protein